MVDDGSTDNSPKICDEYENEFKCVKVIHKSNGGTAEARNMALAIAKGDYIAFVDNDDFIHRDYYKILLSSIQITGADIAVCELTRKSDAFINKQRFEYITTVVNKFDFIKDTYVDNWTRNTAPWNKLYKRHLFDDIRFPIGKGYEDAFTTYRLIYKAKKARIIFYEVN